MALDLAGVQARLPGRRIDWFRSVNSTMTLASQLARDGCASGTVIGADEQVAGIGRHGHAWHSEAEAGVYVSFVLRPELGAERLPVVMLALGLATQEAIAQVTGVAADLRWPNDVMIDGKKCAGILAQLEGSAIVAGIGINVNHTAFPEELRSIATSLRIETGHEYEKEALLERIVAGSLTCAALLECVGKGDILKQFEDQSSYARGKAVEVNDGNRVFSGVTAGLDENGFLRVETAGGIETVMAGGVRATVR